MNETDIIRIFIGAVLLFLGRKLFWFFVGAAGFLAGLVYAPQLFQGQPGWVLLLIAAIAGLMGALLAIVLQRFAVALAGFFIGGYLLNLLLNALGIGEPFRIWTFLAGGLVGALLVSALFDWALIFLSSLTGATLISQSLGLGGALTAVVFTILLIAGIAIQAGVFQRERAPAALPGDDEPFGPQ